MTAVSLIDGQSETASRPFGHPAETHRVNRVLCVCARVRKMALCQEKYLPSSLESSYPFPYA